MKSIIPCSDVVRRPALIEQDVKKTRRTTFHRPSSFQRHQESQECPQEDGIPGNPCAAISIAGLPADSLQVKQLLSVLHTNPDCRYSELKMKRLTSAIGYLPTRGPPLNPLAEEDIISPPHERNEPVFFINALNFCLQFLLPKEKRHVSLLRSGSQADPVLVCGPYSRCLPSAGGQTITTALLGASDAIEAMVKNLLLDTKFTLPRFFNGPLSEAINSVQRAPGCAWPPVLLFLYGRQGMNNRRFVVDVLCGTRAFLKLHDAVSTLNSPTKTMRNRRPSINNSLAGDESSSHGVTPCVTATAANTTYTCLNSLLMERGINLIPWNCSTVANRALLASAFCGTRLEQIMLEIRPEIDFPCLIAMGRNSSSSVVCCKLANARMTLTQVLRWLDIVTRAHFMDYEVDYPPAQAQASGSPLKILESPPTATCTAETADSKGMAPSGERPVQRRLSKGLVEHELPVKFEVFRKHDAKITKNRTKTVFSSFQKIQRCAANKAFTFVDSGVSPPIKQHLIKPNASRFQRDRQTCTSAHPDENQIDSEAVHEMHQFFQRFKEKFTTSLPVEPGFILTKFSTALARCLDSGMETQIKPLLLYLHDDNGPGAPHFIANVLCSQRFNNRLYDCGVGIWPVDLTGTVNSQVGVKQGASKASPYWARLLMRCNPKWTPLNGSEENEEDALAFINQQFPQQAIALIRLFYDHPAGETVRGIIANRILPTLISVGLKCGRFFVSSTLNPSATTKQSVTWLTRVMTAFERHQTTRQLQ